MDGMGNDVKASKMICCFMLFLFLPTPEQRPWNTIMEVGNMIFPDWKNRWLFRWTSRSFSKVYLPEEINWAMKNKSYLVTWKILGLQMLPQYHIPGSSSRDLAWTHKWPFHGFLVTSIWRIQRSRWRSWFFSTPEKESRAEKTNKSCNKTRWFSKVYFGISSSNKSKTTLVSFLLKNLWVLLLAGVPPCAPVPSMVR